MDTSVLTVYGQQKRPEIGYNPNKRGRRSYLALLCTEGATGDVWEAGYHPGNPHASTICRAHLERAQVSQVSNPAPQMRQVVAAIVAFLSLVDDLTVI